MERGADIDGSSFIYKFKVGLVVTLSLLVFSGIFMALISLKNTRLSKFNKDYCRKQDCIWQARSMQENMNKSVHPCRDFFKFTCGNYESENLGQPNFQFSTAMSLFKQYIDIFTNDTVKFIRPAEDLRIFHNACVNLESDGKNYEKYMQDILLRLEWPPLNQNWNRDVSKSFNWLDFEGKLIKMGLSNSLIGFASVTLETKQETLLLDCAPSFITVGWSDILTNSATVKSFTQTVKSFIKLVNGQQKLADEMVEMLIKIEKIKLGTISQRFSFRDTSTILKSIPAETSLGQLDIMWKINFTEFCISLFPSFMNITKNTSIVLVSECPTRLVTFLNNVEKRPVAGYMLWEAARNLMWVISDKTRNLNQDFKSSLPKIVTQPPIIETCYYFNSYLLPELWSYIYVKTYYSEARKNRIVKMANLILDEAKALIKNSWLSAPSRDIIGKKLFNIKYLIDHHEEFVSDEYILSTFGNLKFNTSNMLQCVIDIQAHKFTRYWKMFKLSMEMRTLSRIYPTEINAFYDRSTNLLAIPAAITAGMLYSDDYEGYLSFGALGSIIGHEIFHSLDVGSTMIDDKLNYGLFLNDQDEALFEEKVNCFVEQYNDYHLTPELRVNGYITLDENLADSGVLLAYRAYLRWLRTNRVKKLPGFEDYNDRQLFWISFGNVWCENYNKEYLEHVYYANDSHTIGKLRVLGSLSNLQEFSKDFDCPANSHMNPSKKCKLYY